MTRLALISDLHFGREDKILVPQLLTAIHAAQPDLVAIAGDFVQRARRAQFRRARDFVGALQIPWVAVPGNHDIPLFNIPARILRPRAAYRRWICDDTEPLVKKGAMTLIGVDTTDAWRHQRGRISAAQIERIREHIAAAHDSLPVIMAHHPFHQNDAVAKQLMHGAPRALDVWAGCGPHVILSGHLHSFLAEPFVARKGTGQTLQVHCGSSSSVRHRGNPNDLAILDISAAHIAITRQTFAPEQGFSTHSQFAFSATPDGWRRDLPDEDD